MMRLIQKEQGRTLLEMVAVLSIIGILSMVAVIGYRFAVDKHQLNIFIADLSNRVLVTTDQINKITPPLILGQALVIEGGKVNPLGYQMNHFVSFVNEEYFEIEAQGVPVRICQQIVNNYDEAILLFVNDILYDGESGLCAQESIARIRFIYPVDSDYLPACSQKGFFDSETYMCACSGNTYFEEEKADCLCPVKQVWSDVQKICLESKCQEGEFETLNGCISCADKDPYVISLSSKNLCLACESRYVLNNICAPKCGIDSFSDGIGICHSCFENAKIITSSDEVGCNKCPDRFWAYSHCLKKDFCQDGKSFIALSFEGSPICASCDTTALYRGTKDTVVHDSCNACVNKNGIKNRRVTSSGQCIKSVCDTGEFMGADGQCYSCESGFSVAVKEKSGCEEPSCGRKVINNICQFEKCDITTHVQTKEGCFPCEMTSNFISQKEECESACSAVSSKRRWLGSQGATTGECRLQNCIKGKSFPYPASNSLLCYPCAGWGDGGGHTGFSEYGKEFCEACGNYVAPSGFCFSPKSCTRGTQFRSARQGYDFCHSCDIMSPISIEDHQEHQTMCQDCHSTKRFFSRNYCYRCDTAETPFVFTAQEEESCLSCKIRYLSDGKCLLKQEKNQ